MDRAWTTSFGEETTSTTSTTSSTWLNGRRWDLAWLIGSASIVPVVLVLMWLGATATSINLGVTSIIGGPHLFSTSTTTYMDRRFRRAHFWPLLAITILVPSLVIWGTIHHFQVLLSVFIFAASFHVLQQNAYLTDVYRRRAAQRDSMISRMIDYGLLMISIYPGAAYKLVNATFYLGDIRILIPSILMVNATYWTVWFFFGLFLVAWIVKTFGEARRGVMNRPKTLLIAVTTAVAFSVPFLGSGLRLELAFQAINAWHSIQYLGIVWLILKLRKDRGLVTSPFVRKMSGTGKPAYRFYGFLVATTAGLFGVLLTLYWIDPLKLTFSQYYYMGVLSCLLIHYALDAYLFAVSTRPNAREEDLPLATPAVVSS